MRRLLRFLDFIKRARTATTDAPTAPKRTPLAAALRDQKKESSGAEDPKLAEVIAARRRERWEPPELEGPDFGGLIERRGTDTRGLMPEPWRPAPDEHHKRRQPSQLGSDPGHVNVKSDSDQEIDLESTGVFLSALDNSAITLADSGLFKVGDPPEPEEDDEDSYDPYDKG